MASYDWEDRAAPYWHGNHELMILTLHVLQDDISDLDKLLTEMKEHDGAPLSDYYTGIEHAINELQILLPAKPSETRRDEPKPDASPLSPGDCVAQAVALAFLPVITFMAWRVWS